MRKSVLLPNFSQRDPIDFFTRFTGDRLNLLVRFEKEIKESEEESDEEIESDE